MVLPIVHWHSCSDNLERHGFEADIVPAKKGKFFLLSLIDRKQIVDVRRKNNKHNERESRIKKTKPAMLLMLLLRLMPPNPRGEAQTDMNQQSTHPPLVSTACHLRKHNEKVKKGKTREEAQ